MVQIVGFIKLTLLFFSAWILSLCIFKTCIYSIASAEVSGYYGICVVTSGKREPVFTLCVNQLQIQAVKQR